MTCTAPIDINHTELSCTLKCAYSFNYTDTGIVLSNENDYLKMSYEQPPSSSSTNSQVTYNSKDYNVDSIRLYHPSLHTYGGVQADAELIIIHKVTSGNNSIPPLYVCIPIVVEENVTPTSQTFQLLMKNIPQPTKSIQLKTINFNLNSFIPMAPFYSYTGSSISPACGTICDYVVFSKDTDKTGYITMNKSDYTTLLDVVPGPLKAIQVYPSKDYAINIEGPTYGAGTQGKIMIKCNPVGDNGELLADQQQSVEAKEEAAWAEMYGTSNILQSPIFKYLINFAIMAVVLILGDFIISLVVGKKSQITETIGNKFNEMTGKRGDMVDSDYGDMAGPLAEMALGSSY